MAANSPNLVSESPPGKRKVQPGICFLSACQNHHPVLLLVCSPRPLPSLPLPLPLPLPSPRRFGPKRRGPSHWTEGKSGGFLCASPRTGLSVQITLETTPKRSCTPLPPFKKTKKDIERRKKATAERAEKGRRPGSSERWAVGDLGSWDHLFLDRLKLRQRSGCGRAFCFLVFGGGGSRLFELVSQAWNFWPPRARPFLGVCLLGLTPSER